jgi:hypothetical protein
MATTSTAPRVTVKSAAAKEMGKNLTTLRTYYRGIMAEGRAGKVACQERAQTVYLGIKKSSKFPYGVDKIMAARRQRKAILRMAAGYEMVELAAKAAIGMLNHDFGATDHQQLRNSGFDLTK